MLVPSMMKNYTKCGIQIRFCCLEGSPLTAKDYPHVSGPPRKNVTKLQTSCKIGKIKKLTITFCSQTFKCNNFCSIVTRDIRLALLYSIHPLKHETMLFYLNLALYFVEKCPQAFI